MKFSIRDLLLVTVIVALALAWWLDRSQLTAEIERLKEAPADFNAWFDAKLQEVARTGTRSKMGPFIPTAPASNP